MTYSILNTSEHPLKYPVKLNPNTNLWGSTQKSETIKQNGLKVHLLLFKCSQMLESSVY